jgi:signal transduction histidine kinase
LAQCEGLAHIARAVNAANELTQRNAEMVAESARSAQELVQRTTQLSTAARSIRLRQGSAGEARSLVEKAVALVQRGSVQAAQRFCDHRGEFFGRDMYIFVFNRQGGWVEYQTVNPKTGAVNEKISYVQPLPGDLLIGCGVYKV